MKVFLFTLILSTFLLAQGPVEQAYHNEYIPLNKNKAMAVAINQKSGAWAYGLSENMPSIKSAKNVALKFCREYVKENDVKAACKIYAVNGDVVATNY